MSRSPERGWRGRVAGLLGVALLAAGCLSAGERQRINLWLLCDDCTEATLDNVAGIGCEAVPRLGGALYGPPPHRDSIMRFKLAELYRSLGAPALPEQAFVGFHAGNYRAQYQEHAALALGEIGRGGGLARRLTGCAARAREELVRAFRRDSLRRTTDGGFYRTDVLDVIRDEIESLGETTRLPAAGLNLSSRIDTLAVGENLQLTAALLDITGRVIPGLDFAWGSSDASVAGVNPAGLVTAVGTGTARIVVTTALGPATFSDSALVSVVP